MKQGINNVMKVDIGLNVSTVEKIDFIFKQENAKLRFVYPSDKAERVGSTNAINLFWSSADTYIFDTSKPIYMDSKIYLVDVETNPETKIAKFLMNDTLFEQGE